MVTAYPENAPCRTARRAQASVLCASLLALVASLPATAQEPIDLPGEMLNSLQSTSEAKILDWLREGDDPDTVMDSDGTRSCTRATAYKTTVPSIPYCDSHH